MKKNKRTKNFVSDILMAALLLSFLFLLAIPFFIYNLHKYGLKVDIFTNPGDVLSFYGSILGGIITLGGVIITIDYERRIKNKEFELQYKPILKLEGKKLAPHEASNCEIDIYTDKCFNRLEFSRTCLNLKNVGRGEMLNVTFSNISIEVISSNRKKPFNISFSSLPECKQIPSGENVTFILGFEKPMTSRPGSGELFNISFDVEYFGCLKTTRYKSRVSFCVEYTPTKGNRLYNFKIEY